MNFNYSMTRIPKQIGSLSAAAIAFACVTSSSPLAQVRLARFSGGGVTVDDREQVWEAPVGNPLLGASLSASVRGTRRTFDPMLPPQFASVLRSNTTSSNSTSASVRLFGKTFELAGVTGDVANEPYLLSQLGATTRPAYKSSASMSVKVKGNVIFLASRSGKRLAEDWSFAHNPAFGPVAKTYSIGPINITIYARAYANASFRYTVNTDVAAATTDVTKRVGAGAYGISSVSAGFAGATVGVRSTLDFGDHLFESSLVSNPVDGMSGGLDVCRDRLYFDIDAYVKLCIFRGCWSRSRQIASLTIAADKRSFTL